MAPDVRTPYERVMRGGARKKPVVVAIAGNVCGGCKTALPPSVINEVMKGKELISCDTCSSILHIPPKAAEPAAPADAKA
jgi:predicted  nucleic acid-binding Zn-ribbon protein